jgi:hypothetical protein
MCRCAQRGGVGCSVRGLDTHTTGLGAVPVLTLFLDLPASPQTNPARTHTALSLPLANPCFKCLVCHVVLTRWNHDPLAHPTPPLPPAPPCPTIIIVTHAHNTKHFNCAHAPTYTQHLVAFQLCAPHPCSHSPTHPQHISHPSSPCTHARCSLGQPCRPSPVERPHNMQQPTAWDSDLHNITRVHVCKTVTHCAHEGVHGRVRLAAHPSICLLAINHELWASHSTIYNAVARVLTPTPTP